MVFIIKIEEKMTQKNIAATIEDKGQRFDQFLTKQLAIPRAQVGKLIKSCAILCDEKPIKASQLILGHEIFAVTPPETVQLLVPENIALDILYSDDDIAVINKPVGLVVHPGAGIKTGTLCHALLYHFPKLLEAGGDRPGIVHRLDKDTSGVMVVAKNAQALAKLSEDFKERRVKKTYRTLAWGEIKEFCFELKTGHARHATNRLRFTTKLSVPEVPTPHVRMAHTSFKVLKRGFGLTELSAIIHTGRTHQIRAHLSDIDHPLVGDALYNGKREISGKVSPKLKEALLSFKAQALHSERLEFNHPKTNEPMSFSAPIPDILARASENL